MWMRMLRSFRAESRVTGLGPKTPMNGGVIHRDEGVEVECVLVLDG